MVPNCSAQSDITKNAFLKIQRLCLSFIIITNLLPTTQKLGKSYLHTPYHTRSYVEFFDKEWSSSSFKRTKNSGNQRHRTIKLLSVILAMLFFWTQSSFIFWNWTACRIIISFGYQGNIVYFSNGFSLKFLSFEYVTILKKQIIYLISTEK